MYTSIYVYAIKYCFLYKLRVPVCVCKILDYRFEMKKKKEEEQNKEYSKIYGCVCEGGVLGWESYIRLIYIT